MVSDSIDKFLKLWIELNMETFDVWKLPGIVDDYLQDRPANFKSIYFDNISLLK